MSWCLIKLINILIFLHIIIFTKILRNEDFKCSFTEGFTYNGRLTCHFRLLCSWRKTGPLHACAHREALPHNSAFTGAKLSLHKITEPCQFISTRNRVPERPDTFGFRATPLVNFRFTTLRSESGLGYQWHDKSMQTESWQSAPMVAFDVSKR
jgi:hypothetical protein